MIVSIEAFRRKTLMHKNPAKRWSAEGGASLRTFFVGRCLMEFPDVYVKWNRERRRARLKIPDDPDAWAESAYEEGYLRESIPEAKAMPNLMLEHFTKIDERAVFMFRLQDEGYSYAEIAEMLSDTGEPTTEAAVRTRMHRLRAKADKEIGTWPKKAGNQ